MRTSNAELQQALREAVAAGSINVKSDIETIRRVCPMARDFGDWDIDFAMTDAVGSIYGTTVVIVRNGRLLSQASTAKFDEAIRAAEAALGFNRVLCPADPSDLSDEDDVIAYHMPEGAYATEEAELIERRGAGLRRFNVVRASNEDEDEGEAA